MSDVFTACSTATKCCLIGQSNMVQYSFLNQTYECVQFVNTFGDEQCVSLTSSLSWLDLYPFLFRVWSIWAGWDCLKICQRERTSPPHSTTREPCTKPGRSVSMYGKSFFKWGMFTCKTHWQKKEIVPSIHMFGHVVILNVVTFAAPWRYQTKWGSTWRRPPLITGKFRIGQYESGDVLTSPAASVFFALVWSRMSNRCTCFLRVRQTVG